MNITQAPALGDSIASWGRQLFRRDQGIGKYTVGQVGAMGGERQVVRGAFLRSDSWWKSEGKWDGEEGLF